MAKSKVRGDGRCVRKVYLGLKKTGAVDDNGEPVYKKEYSYVYGRTQKEADAKRDELKVKLGKGIDVSTMKDSFGTWAERYLAGKVAEGLSQIHLDNLDRFARRFGPVWNKPISNVEIGELQDVINRYAVADGERAALGKSTLGCMKRAASGVFKVAIAARAIEYNPAEYVRVPKTAAHETREPIEDKQRTWIEETPHRARRAAMIMLYAGLRRGEVTALTWSDINLCSGEISVSRAVSFDNSGRPHVKSTKTDAGRRIVKIPAKLILFLSSEKQQDECLYVLHTQNGSMFTKIAWQRLWDSYMADLNAKYGYTREIKKMLGMDTEKDAKKCRPGGLQMIITPFTPHQLRHTYATMLYFAGVDVLTARDQLGHNDVKTTLAVYTHLDKKHKRASMEKFDTFLSGVSEGGQEQKKTS